MATALDRELLKTALREVKGVCREPIVYRRKTGGEMDLDAGKSEQDIKEIPIYATKNGFSLQTLGTGFQSGSVIEASDILLTVPAIQFDFVPEAGDEVEFDDVAWVIKGKRPIYGASAVIMWELQVRHG
jgi:hypothetical protein